MAVMPMPLQLVDHLRALRAVCAVDSCGSSIAAAQALHLSQSSVVRAVQALEATLDGALFERSGRGMVATDMGRGVALRTRRALFHLASVDPRGRRGAGADALAWTASRLAAGVGARHLAVLPALAQGGSEAVGGARLGISQSNRFYFYRWGPEGPPIPPDEIVRNSSNMHLIPANPTIQRQLDALRVGERILLKGQLVDASTADGWRWSSSRSRTDTGHGACELMWVDAVAVLPPA